MHFVTGFPGFIGRRLVAALAARDADTPIVVLVQGSMAAQAAACAQEIAPGRIEILTGDITDRKLGLGDATYDRIASEVRLVWHLAAIYDLAVPKEVAQAVNVEGTGNVLELCLAAGGLERLAYVSTAYVAGLRTGVVYEHELSLGQDFKNHYESTKFQAEVWVRDELDRIPTTIIRPAIVVGDSQTGETEKFDGPYYILRVVSLADRLRQSMPQFGRGEAAFNVVPVDYVVAATVAAAHDPACVGQTLHLVDPQPLSSRELVELLSNRYAGRAPRGRLPARLVQQSLRLKLMREAFAGTPRESVAYLNHPVRYDARRTVDLLAPHDLVPPRFDDYADAIVAFFKAHEDDPAYRPKAI